MLTAERRNRILARLESDGSVLVSALGEEFCVSEETIRRDLARLEAEGLAVRCYGGASVVIGRRDLPYSVRKRSNVAGKRKIAAAIAELVPDGAFIMLDDSSTSTFAAEAFKGKKNITLITNSIEIVMSLSEVRGWNIMLTGGTLKPDLLSMTGQRAESFFRGYHVDIAVISCTGLDISTGFTDAAEDNALMKRAMMESAEHVILAADSRKFGRRAFAPIGELSEVWKLVTDAEPDDTWKNALSEAGTDLIF